MSRARSARGFPRARPAPTRCRRRSARARPARLRSSLEQPASSWSSDYEYKGIRHRGRDVPAEHTIAGTLQLRKKMLENGPVSWKTPDILNPGIDGAGEEQHARQ